MCILDYLSIINCRFPSFMWDLLKSPVIYTFVRKSHVCTMWLKFLNALYSICWELSNQYSDVYINICMQKIPNRILHNLRYQPLISLDNLELLHKFLCIVKISSPVILQIWENKSGAGADLHPFRTVWSLIYTLSPAALPLNVRIIWSDLFQNFLIFALFASVITIIGRIRIVARRWVWQVIFPMLFFLIAFFSLISSLTKISLMTSLTMMVMGPGLSENLVYLVCALFYFLKFPLIVFVDCQVMES